MSLKQIREKHGVPAHRDKRVMLENDGRLMSGKILRESNGKVRVKFAGVVHPLEIDPLKLKYL